MSRSIPTEQAINRRAAIFGCALAFLYLAMATLFAPRSLSADSSAWLRLLMEGGAFGIAGFALYGLQRQLGHARMRSVELERLNASQLRQVTQTEESLRAAQAECARERAAAALERSEMIAAHRRASESLAVEFEQATGAIAHSITATAELLKASASTLTVHASEAGEEANAIVLAAEQACKAANTVAAGVAELSLSIAEVALHASEQSALTVMAAQRSDGGGKAIGALSKQSCTIGEATRAIVRIAERTNLLALNAAIEAASAGSHGRGFNTVAQEIKILAEQAGQSAVQIETFLKGVQSGTIEAESSFKAIETTIDELATAATTIRYDVENQRQSADTIEVFARKSARDTDIMVKQLKLLAQRTNGAQQFSQQLDQAAAVLIENAASLDRSAKSITARLRRA